MSVGVFVVLLSSWKVVVQDLLLLKQRKTTDSGQKPSRMTLNFINGKISCDNNSKVSSLYFGYLFLVNTHRVLIWAYWFCFTVILGWWSTLFVGVFIVLSSSWKVVVQDLLLLK